MLAGQYGSGKRGGGVSTLICAVLDDRQLGTEDEEMKFVHWTLCNLFMTISAGILPLFA